MDTLLPVASEVAVSCQMGMQCNSSALGSFHEQFTSVAPSKKEEAIKCSIVVQCNSLDLDFSRVIHVHGPM